MSRRITALIAVSTTVGGLLLTASPALAGPITETTVSDVVPAAPAVTAQDAAPEQVEPAPTEAQTVGGTNATPAPDAGVAPEGETDAPAPGEETAGDGAQSDVTATIPADSPSDVPVDSSGDTPDPSAVGDAVDTEPAKTGDAVSPPPAATSTATATAAAAAAAAAATILDQPAAVAPAEGTAVDAPSGLTPPPLDPDGFDEWDDQRKSEYAVGVFIEWFEANEALLVEVDDFWWAVGEIEFMILEGDYDGLADYLAETFPGETAFGFGLLQWVFFDLYSEGLIDEEGKPIVDEEESAGPTDETPTVPAVPAEPAVKDEPAAPVRIEPVTAVVAPRAPVAPVAPVAAAPSELAQTGPEQTVAAGGLGALLLLAGAAMVRVGSRARRPENAA